VQEKAIRSERVSGVISELSLLSKAIHDEVYKTFFDFKTAVFLCGAGVKSDKSVRAEIDKLLRDWRFFYRYDIVYPEEIFDELLFGQNHQDLLTLESILADSVDAIVLVIESYGAVAELGAFASSDRLRGKLVCVVDGKHKKAKSFINYGPLRLLKDTGEGEIVYADFSRIGAVIEPIRKGITKVKKATTKSARVNNVLQAHHYILPCIFLLEPASRDLLIDLVTHASGTSKAAATAITSAGLSMLRKNREVILTPEGYRLTTVGYKRFLALGRRGRSETTFDPAALDRLRIAVLSWRYRGKRLTV
jgi:hypothetical protein